MNIEEEANYLARKYFSNLVDKGDNPYMDHLLYVSSHGRNETERVVGLLHDILEDTPVTSTDLSKMGFPSSIIRKLELLTKPENVNYDIYIHSILESKDANVLFVKKTDMENNMDLTRLKVITDKDLRRVEQKYQPNYEKICIALNDLERDEKD